MAKKITKRDIIEAYIRLHNELKHVDISMQLLSEKSGYSRRTIYTYFANKEELIQASIDSEFSSLNEIDFSNKTAIENAKLFVSNIDQYRKLILISMVEHKLINKIARQIEEAVHHQKLVKNKMASNALAWGISNAAFEYCKNNKYKLDDLEETIVLLIKPYVEK